MIILFTRRDQVLTLVLRTSLIPGALKEKAPYLRETDSVRRLWEEMQAADYEAYSWNVPLPPAQKRIAKGDCAYALALQVCHALTSHTASIY